MDPKIDNFSPGHTMPTNWWMVQGVLAISISLSSDWKLELKGGILTSEKPKASSS